MITTTCDAYSRAAATHAFSPSPEARAKPGGVDRKKRKLCLLLLRKHRGGGCSRRHTYSHKARRSSGRQHPKEYAQHSTSAATCVTSTVERACARGTSSIQSSSSSRTSPEQPDGDGDGCQRQSATCRQDACHTVRLGGVGTRHWCVDCSGDSKVPARERN